jgi:hypothetical protein
MTAVSTRPETVLTLLFGADAQAHDALGHAIGHAGTAESLERAVGELPKAARDAAAREVTAATAGLLNIQLIDVLLTGWREHRDLTSAARRTLAAPDSTELVQLVTHRVSTSQDPYVAILVDGHQVATVHLGLSIVFDVSAVLAQVRRGRLVGIHSGSCDVTVTLAIDDIDVASSQAHLDLPGEIALRHELRLLPAEDYPSDENQVRDETSTADETEVIATDDVSA